ncbi:MAG: alpha/beta hydrolase fold domain-containing protein [Pirellulaceae bacterium]
MHGGGFVVGDKSSIRPQMIRMAHEAGISVAAADYRFVDGADVKFPMPQLDCARAASILT